MIKCFKQYKFNHKSLVFSLGETKLLISRRSNYMVFSRYYLDEYVDHCVYLRLSKIEKDGDRKKVLETLAKQEQEHLLFWKSLMGGETQKISIFWKIRIYLFILVRYIFGITFAVKLLERNEKKVIERYKALLGELEGKNREKLESIIKDELEHENFWVSQIKDTSAIYLGFIVLGLADAIIEITGVHAGFLGATTSTIVAGVAGLVVGISASIAMASAAYLQAKQGEVRNSKIASIYTGIYYNLAALALALPYFLTHDMFIAFFSSLAVAILLAAYFNYYSAVVYDKPFLREFLLNTGVLLLAAFVAFLFGEFLGNIFGINKFFK